MQRRIQKHLEIQSQHMFTASEVAEYEYCPLAWWYERFDPAVGADDEALFAEMVALEHEYGEQAPSIPDYQMLERLLVRRGAFDEGRQQHLEHAEAVEEAEELARDQLAASESGTKLRRALLFAVVLLLLAVLVIVIALLLGHLL